MSHKAIQFAVVNAEPVVSDKDLVAYYIVRSGFQLEEISSLKQWLKQKLPNYQIPQYYIQVNSFPLSTSGKVDRKSLSTWRKQQGIALKVAETIGNELGISPVQKVLLKVWSDVLKVPVGKYYISITL